MERYAQPTEAPEPGDVAVWRFGRAFSHAGILVSTGMIVHALVDSATVTLHRVDETPLAHRPVKYFTLFGAPA